MPGASHEARVPRPSGKPGAHANSPSDHEACSRMTGASPKTSTAFSPEPGVFLRSRPGLHTVALTVTEALRTRGAYAYGSEAPVFGWLERAGEVRAAFFRTPPRRPYLNPLTPIKPTASPPTWPASTTPFPASVRTTPRPPPSPGPGSGTRAPHRRRERERLYRLGTLTPPEPLLEGRGRIAGEQDREQLKLCHREFLADIGGTPAADNSSGADTRIANRRVTFWETPDGTPVSLAGVTPMVAGQIRVPPVYTPAHLRGRGYAGAATVEVSRAALAAGAAEVLLFADLANPAGPPAGAGGLGGGTPSGACVVTPHRAV